MSNISFDIIDTVPEITIDILSLDSPIAIDDINILTSFSVDLIYSQPISIDMVSGGIKGDKGDSGIVDNYDPGDLTLIFDNKLI